MSADVKRILAVVLGALTAFAIIMGCEIINSTIYPPPVGEDLTDPLILCAFVASMPNSAFILVLVGYVLGSFFGGLVASLISGREKGRAPLTVGIVALVGGCANLFMIPCQPNWYIVTSLLIFVPFAYSGHLVVKKKK